MNENLRTQMEQMAIDHAHECFPYNASGNSPLHEVHLLNQKHSFIAGFTACSEIYEKELAALKEENKRFRLALEQYENMQWRPIIIQFWPLTRSDKISKVATKALADSSQGDDNV